jgi:hypothetical protein
MAEQFAAQTKPVQIVEWLVAHPCVMDVDGASERLLAVIGNLAADKSTPEFTAIVDLLNELVDTVGNCETEERHLKGKLWSEIVARAEDALVH